MKKTVLKSVSLLSAIAFSSFAYADVNTDFGIAAPQLNAQTYILMDYNSGAVLASLNPDQRQYPASLTKMMTGYVVGDAIKQGKVRNSDMVTVTENSWAQKFPGSSLMFLDLNTQVSVSDLMKGLVIVSGNDAAVALAEHTSGSQQVFIDQMNKYAQQFGLKNTYFTTVHGLDDPNQFSSARDMAIIGAHIIRDQPEEYKIYAEKEFKYNIKKPQPNRNGLLWDKTMNVDGMKTGHTNKAGYNLVASATNSNTRLISVVMGVPTYKGREVESKKLLQWGFANFETVKSLPAGQAVKEESVYYGDKNKVQLGSVQDSFITIPKGKSAELKARYELAKSIEAPLAQGQVVGKVIYQLDGKDVAESPLQALQAVEEAGVFGKAWDWLVLTVKSVFN